MPETEEQTEKTEQTDKPAPEQPKPAEEPHGTDWKAEARKWEERSKANRAELDTLKAQMDELRAAQAEQADAAERAEAAERELEDLRREKAHMEMVSAVSQATSVPASLLHGSTEEELTASAQAVMDFATKLTPSNPSDIGGSKAGAAPSPASIESIKDPIARIRARARNIELN